MFIRGWLVRLLLVLWGALFGLGFVLFSQCRSARLVSVARGLDGFRLGFNDFFNLFNRLDGGFRNFDDFRFRCR